jgi:hypothetical protein
MYYHTDKKLEAWRMEAKEDFRLYRAESNAMISAIQLEIKDFHSKLCSIEEKKESSKSRKQVAS